MRYIGSQAGSALEIKFKFLSRVSERPVFLHGPRIHSQVSLIRFDILIRMLEIPADHANLL